MYEFEFVVATQKSRDDFWTETAFGQSWRMHQNSAEWKCTSIYVRPENKQGLPEVYNRRINDPNSGEYLVFVHDDVFLNDYFTPQRLREAFLQFDVVGIVGNRRLLLEQPSWAYIGRNAQGKMQQDDLENLCGSIGQGKDTLGVLNRWGESPAEVAVVDGVFIAVNKRKLLETGTRFDPMFTFDFYDTDFCRAATTNGLSVGVWPIAISHQSGGAFGPRWFASWQQYLDKWNKPKAQPESKPAISINMTRRK